MPNAPRKTISRPALCPSCGKPVTLLVASSLSITTQVHNGRSGCNATVYYRCWIEQGLRLPRVEFFDEANATRMMFDKSSGLRATAASDLSARRTLRPVVTKPSNRARRSEKSRAMIAQHLDA